MLRFCSYLVWWILFLSRFHILNMSKIGECLTMSKILDPIFLTIRKKSPLNFWYVALNRQIYLEKWSKSTGQHWALGAIFDWDTIFLMLRNGHCAQTVGSRSKIFSPEKPPYWVVLIPLLNQNSAKEIYIPVSKFSHSYTLKLGKSVFKTTDRNVETEQV